MNEKGFLNCLVYGIRTSLIERIKAARKKSTDDLDRVRLLPHKSDVLENGIFDESALPLSINTNVDVDFTRPIVNSYDRFTDSPHQSTLPQSLANPVVNTYDHRFSESAQQSTLPPPQ